MTHLIHLLIGLIKEVASLRGGPLISIMNFVGTLLLFALVVFFMADGTFEFIYAKVPSPEGYAMMNRALIAFLIFTFAVISLISVALSSRWGR